MAQVPAINFLPAAFRSDTNQRFFGATVDQLIKDSANKPISGYIGRTFSPTYKLGDNYVPETGGARRDYQLEPSAVVKDANKNIIFSAGYTDLLRSIATAGGSVNNHQRLFSSDQYNYDGRFDYDKFINYSNYYWLPDGPDAVTVTAGSTPYQATYTVTRNTDVGGYTFSTLGGHPNTQLTLARGGTYQFIVNQPGNPFWIQSKPGVTGRDPNISNLTTRDVMGVKNNGIDVGTVTFNVPQPAGQDFYTTMKSPGSVDVAVTFNYTKIQNRLLSDFLEEFPTGIDGLTTLLNRKTFIFIGGQVDSSEWTTPSLPAGFVSTSTIRPGNIINNPQRTGIWQLNITPLPNGDSLIQVEPNTVVAVQQKVLVKSGTTNANKEFWVNNIYRYTQVPTITADAKYLFYQDGTDGAFGGDIKLVDNVATKIDIDADIVGRVGYTSPNGVIFTNGLKVQFDSAVTPSSYANKTYYVEGVGTAIRLIATDALLVPNHLSAVINQEADYLTINRSSKDGNPWSGTNRWFHKDVLSATAAYNKQSLINYGPNIPGRRPIVEFDPDLQLWHYGRQAKTRVDLFVQQPSDAFVDIEGQITYTLHETVGDTTVSTVLESGMRIIFANDFDTNVKNQIWQVSIEVINGRNFIRLAETSDDPVLDGEHVFVMDGLAADRVFAFNGTTNSWFECQYKSTFNQAPLFDLVDADGYSFGDTTMYPSSTFTGTKFFNYVPGAGSNDTVLGFPLKYQNFNSIGDIVFNNYYDTDTFTYTGGTINCNSGYLKKNIDLDNSTKLNNWVTSIEPTIQHQILTKFFDGFVITDKDIEYAFVRIDILPEVQKTVPYIQVYINNKLLTINVDYKLTKYGAYDIVLFTNNADNTLKLSVGDKIDIAIHSKTKSGQAYYEVPNNLDYNPLNENFSTITLGQLRAHYNKLIENTAAASTGNRPLRDSYVKAQGGTLVQQSSPLLYSLAFLNDPAVNFIDSINLARKEYTKFKNKFLNLCETLTTLNYQDPIGGVDTLLQNINAIKNSSFPWYYSDMVPQGKNYNIITYTVNNTRQTNYEISSIFDNTQLSGRAIIVYVNDQQLTVGQDYTFSKISPAIIFSTVFAIGDVITIRDYASTDGNYIPETPTKLGLFPKYVPEIYLDTTFQESTQVIRGHDGSITPAFGDFRDQYLLELERRIYNNIKTNNDNNVVNFYDFVPGRFRTTDYTFNECNYLLSSNFLQWTGSNNIDYTTNSWFTAENQWSWNYATGFEDVVDGSNLQGSWRAIYKYWYDTDTPNLTPWEMVGFSSQPQWWTARYGNAPYTKGNSVLWDDMEAGYIWNNGAPYYDSRFARPGLSNFIPVDTSGNLLSPTAIPLTKKYSTQFTSNTYAVGQQGPVETAWRRSSDFPYAIQIALALAKPAQYFSTQLDVSRFYTNPVTGQLSDINNQKITPSLIAINGDNTTGTVKRSSGYLNWIVDGIKNLGIDPVVELNNYFTNLSVQLTYKVGGFTDQKLITVTAEQTSPGSTNASVIIPDENYSVYLNKSVPIYSPTYSAVIVEKTEVGYSVTGYDTNTPFFVVEASKTNTNKETVLVNKIEVNFYNESSKKLVSIPYGTVFSNVQQVVDFLVSYERFLKTRGFVFEQFDQDLQKQRDFKLSAQEFVYWTQQGFNPGSIIVLNPAADKLEVTSPYSVVDEITNLPNKSRLLDQNFNPIKSTNFNIVRSTLDAQTNKTTVTTLNSETICFAKFNLVQFEHVLVFDNVDNFGDIIYLPKLGNRQFRLGVRGVVTGGWNGSLNATGYVYSNPVISKWQAGTDYKLGDIVEFNSAYYTASTDIPAAQNFSITLWTKLKYSDIQTGLLPSLGTNAAVFEKIYDIDNPPANENLQMFSSALIGFRERPFLTDLGLSIGNQTKFYQGYIKQKGTINAINALTRATFNNIKGEINTYEEWAFQAGNYGDVDNNKFIEFELDQSVFTTNPVALVASNTYDPAPPIVSLAITGNATTSNVYNSSNLASTTTSLYYNRNSHNRYENDLPYAGFVNLNDIDKTIFDISSVSQIEELESGNKVWVAKDNNKNWNVFRVSETNLIALKMTYTLDNYVRVDFNNPHNFSVDDFAVIKQFDRHWDGLYQIVGIPNALSITIQIVDKLKLGYLISVSPVVSTGVIYKLTSLVLDTVRDVESVRPLYDWNTNERVWVTNATSIGWGVYNFNRPWLANTVQSKYSNSPVTSGMLGTSVVATADNNWIFVAEPGGGNVHIFGNVNYTYTVSNVISGVDAGFGKTVATAGNVVAISAPTAGNVHLYTRVNGVVTPLQTITSSNANGLLGTSIAFSSNAQWMYVTEPGNKQVHAYYTANVTVGNIHYVPVANITSNSAIVTTTSDGSRMFIGAPDDTNVYAQNGNVYIYTRTDNTLSLSKTISSQHKNANANFGASIDVDATGNNLFVGVPNSTVSYLANGLVERWVFDGTNYVHNANIFHPGNKPGTFGTTIAISDDARVLAVGSGGSSGSEDTTFDKEKLVIDANATKFVDVVLNSGAVYTFEPLVNYSINGDLGEYNYIQELSSKLHRGDEFGSSIVATRDVLVVGAPGTENSAINNAGQIHIYTNPNKRLGWELMRQQEPKVDINSINRTFIYNKINNNILAALDYIDPAKGKVLNSVAADIDYQRVEDPAIYNAGTGTTHTDYHWGPDQVGRIWWDLNAIRYIDYEQDSLSYRLNHWGERFPGSEVLVYEWVESTVLPSKYTGDGEALHVDDSAYSTYGYVDATGNVRVKYYFWVKNKTTTNVSAGKQNSAYSIAVAIENPQTQGITYATVLRDDAIALHNATHLLSGKSSVLHVTSRSTNAGLIHSEYALVQEGNPASIIPANIKNKFIDSLAGRSVSTDIDGNEILLPVPDPLLTPAQAYGINIRPRQSMFVNRDLALTNYLELVNNKLLTYPTTRRKVLTILNSSEGYPNASAGGYVQNEILNTESELGYINTNGISIGHKVLVLADSTYQNKWVIYSWSGSAWTVSRVQSYKTNQYWTYTDWYDSNYDPTIASNLTVATTLELGKQLLTPNTYVKVLDAGHGEFEIYYVDNNLNQTLVGIQNGTIQINTSIPAGKELRQILIGLQDEIFIADLALYYNQIFFALIRYALTEQKNPDWVFKTSFLAATQYIRKLEQFPSYISDNQDYYKEYINEVKPYRTVVREFVVDYIRDDQYRGDITDFDLPPYWDRNLNVYRSPSGEQGYDSTLLTSGLYKSWADNHSYKLIKIQVDKPGSGYILPPQVIIKDHGGAGAEAYAVLNGSGGVGEIVITNPGTGFITTPNIVINGSGTGAIASPVLRNIYIDDATDGYNVVRSVNTTLKFDRTNYTNSNTFVFWDTLDTTANGVQVPANTIIRTDDVIYKLIITDWTANSTANVNSLVYYSGNTYITNGNTYGTLFTSNNVVANISLVTTGARAYTIDSNLTLPIGSVTTLHASDFDNANDRIVAFNGNVDFSLTTDGIDYPGVIVDGGNLKVINSSRTIGSPAIATDIDSIIQSKFIDELGINPSDIAIDGGTYISRFSSHAPQELVPGRMYDSLNFTVYDQDALGFRIFNDMNKNVNYYRISETNTTTLTNNLSLTDEVIYVADATKLPLPDRYYGFPGVIFINGEKIIYWRNYALENPTPWHANLNIGVGELISYSGNVYATAGNVYARYFANVTANVSLVTNRNQLGRIRRAVDGTSAQTIHRAGTRVVDASRQQLLPTEKPITSVVTSDTSYKVTDVESITLGLQLTSPISANVGDELTQKLVVDPWKNVDYDVGQYVYWAEEDQTYVTTGNALIRVVAWQSNTTYPTGSYVTQAGNTYITTGNVWAQNKMWSSNTVFPTGSNIYIGQNSYYTTTGNVYVSIPTWTSNTTFTANSSIYHNGNVYRVTGNVYAPNITWSPGINVPTGSYVHYQGTTYITTGNVGYVKHGNSAPTIASFNDIYWRLVPVETTAADGAGFMAIKGNVVDTGSILQFGNINANVQFLYQGINAGFNSVKSRVQYLPTMDISWQPNTAYTINSYISNNGNIYIVDGNIYGSTFASISSNVHYSSPLQTPEESQFATLLASGHIEPAFTGNTSTSVTLRMMDTVSNVSVAPIVITVGSITSLPEIFDGTGFDVESFDNTPGELYISSLLPNGALGDPVKAYSFVKTAHVLGKVTLAGTANISAGSTVTTEPAWYNRGLSSATDGYGLINSMTPVAQFLKDYRAFIPTEGTTP